MTNITISDLEYSGSNLSFDSESYLKDLSKEETCELNDKQSKSIVGGYATPKLGDKQSQLLVGEMFSASFRVPSYRTSN